MRTLPPPADTSLEALRAENANLRAALETEQRRVAALLRVIEAGIGEIR